jgi:tetratricopeptide (TPR) repeat protein
MAKRRSGRATTAPAPGTAKPSTTKAPPKAVALSILALIVLVIAVYAPVSDYPYVNWDDADYVTGNRHVMEGLTSGTVGWAATANTAGNWHPVTMLSHALVVEFFGAGAGPQHVANVVLHLANTLLLFGVLHFMTGSWGRSFFVAAVFAVHPIHVESVAWVSERKDVLSTCFWLLAVWMYLRYVRQPGLASYLLLTTFFAFALMSKPMTVTLPIVLLLLDVWPLKRAGLGTGDFARWKPLIAEKIPLFVLALLAGVVTLVFQSRAGAVTTLESLDFLSRVSGALYSYLAYIGQTFWPVNLSPFYPPQAVPLWLAGVSVVVLAAVTVLAVRVRERWPFVFVGWFWFLIVLLPTIGIVKAGEQARADRYMYVPLVGLLLILAWGLPELLKRWSRNSLLLPALVGLVLVAAVAVARAQVHHWSDSEALWRHAVNVTADNRRGYENLGQALRERGQLTEAYSSYERALALSSPTHKAVIHNAMGLVAIGQNRVKDAITHFQAAIGISPVLAEARTNLGNALSADGRHAEAIEHYRIALQLSPDSAETQLGIAGALSTMRRFDEARTHYREAIRLQPGLAEAHSGLGTALAQTGDFDGAVRELSEAVRLNPGLVNANLNLGLILAQRGDRARAIFHLEAALRLAPSLSVARDALAALR